jgi:dephospho-CoA kinase
MKGYRMIIGLTGPIASGKGLATKAIKAQLGHEPVTTVLLSDYIREVVREDDKPLDRNTLREAGNALREKNGPGAWVKRMFERLPEGNGGVLLVDSIRNPGEIEELRAAFGKQLFVLATDAPVNDRIKRVLKRAREDDSTDTAEIERQMRIEMEDNPETGFGIERCRALSDAVSLGKESKAERVEEVQEWVREFSDKIEREASQERLRERRVA